MSPSDSAINLNSKLLNINHIPIKMRTYISKRFKLKSVCFEDRRGWAENIARTRNCAVLRPNSVHPYCKWLAACMHAMPCRCIHVLSCICMQGDHSCVHPTAASCHAWRGNICRGACGWGCWWLPAASLLTLVAAVRGRMGNVPLTFRLCKFLYEL